MHLITENKFSTNLHTADSDESMEEPLPSSLPSIEEEPSLDGQLFNDVPMPALRGKKSAYSIG